MCHEKKICILSLSKTDRNFKFTIGIKGAIKWLEGKKEPPHRYFFSKKKPKEGLSPGSIVLFSFEGQIFGEAIVKEDIKPLSDSTDYKYYLTLDPSSIRVFHFFPTKEQITEKTELLFGQLFTYINFDQYNKILEMTEKT
ncbi:hypothetical protein G4O51_05770 [Candidatus Bathyarchaeota archaeon A05DMB-2]|jgi:hypothetical protein|nr:hypothetical protein [Candidatus Bathyarchaeota archaeon A05DMB-2]